MKVRAFVNGVDGARVAAAIREAEARSTGEVRVHVSSTPVEDAEAEAARRFASLGMAATAEHNGILIYIAPASRKFAILGDVGIHARCGGDFWRDVAHAMQDDFRLGQFTEGIVKGVQKVGDVLATHFPRAAGHVDTNELPDEISED